MAGPRFTELKAAGRIAHAGDRRKNRSGRYAEVCAAIPNYQRGWPPCKNS